MLLVGDELESLRDPGGRRGDARGGWARVCSSRSASAAQVRSEETLTYWEAIAIGAAQAAALVPGVSRSGATLTVALLLGLRREGAARFVFLLSLPAVFAAAAKETLDLMDAGAVGLPATLVCRGAGGLGRRRVPDDQVLPAVSGESFTHGFRDLSLRARRQPPPSG